MPRPTVMTPEVIAKLEEAFAWGCTDREACLWAGIAVSTLQLHQDREPEFIERKEALKDTPVLLARKSVVNKLPRDSDLSLKYLERKKKNEFSLKTETTMEVTLPTPILNGLSVEDAKDQGTD